MKMLLAVAAGGDRQELHEVIRTHSLAAADRLKTDGGDNDLLERLATEPAFAEIGDELEQLLVPERFTGRAAEQVEEFLAAEVEPLLATHGADDGDGEEELRV